jgi:tRNA pseudouridine38-40 synthase
MEQRLTRYRIVVEYDGTPFAGWQKQENGSSVQGELEAALLKLDGAPVLVHGAGRTDAGVHALGQVAHFDLVHDRGSDTVRDALNAFLRHAPITVMHAEPVDAQFHARFDAVERRYLYRILDRRSPPALDAKRVWHIATALDAEAMHEAAKALIGNHDFSTFRDAQCQAESAVKTLDHLAVSRVGDEIQVTARARSFLHRQVRSIVGSLSEVGRGRWRIGDMKRALEARDRAACGRVAPAHGLYLVAVRYL